MRKIFILLFACLAIKGYGQTAASYSSTRSVGTPTTITGGSGTVVTTTFSSDEALQASIPIGFSFVYCGTTYTSLSAGSNGWLSLANYSSTFDDLFTNAATYIPGAGFLMPYWYDLDGTGASGYYQTSGTAPNRVFAIQWGQPSPAAQRWGNFGGNGRACFQVKLYESSNIVEFNYLFSNYSLSAGTVGIANSTTDYRTLPTVASTTSNTSFTASLANAPAANSVIDWTPPPTMSVSPSTLSFTTAPSTTSTPQNVTLVAYGLTAGVTVTAPANFQVWNGSAWVSSYTVANTAAALGTYINSTIQVQFVGPATTGTYTGNLTFTSTGATTRTVALTGNVIATCSGTPTPGTLSATATSGSCSPYTPTLSTTGTSSSFGIGYQWQSSPDNITYSNVAGATNTTYAPTISGNIYYRARITCSYSGISANTPGVLFSYTAPPAAITGPSAVCVASTISLSDATSGGTWASSATGVATVNSSGVVTGVAIGTANITYTASGCPVTYPITVNGAPSVISFSPSSSGTVCLGNGSAFTATTTGPAATILSQDFNSGMGTWSITNTSGSSVSYWQIRTPPGYSGLVTGDGTPYIQAAPDDILTNTTTLFTSPTFSTVGYSAVTLTYNQEFESYTGDVTVAVQISINGGTTWNNLVNQLGTSDYSYSWTAASPQRTVSFPAAALGQANVKIRWNYNSTFGFWWAVDNIKVTGTSAVTYAWTGPAGLSCTTCNNPTITPTATGASVYTLTATATANSCTRTGNVTVTANPLPVNIGGTASVCSGLTTTLTDATTGGTWSSSNSGIASINSSGVVTGGTAGTATITYTITSTGCFTTKVVTVNPLPANITGTASACVGASTTLADATTPGTWSSGTTGIATIGSSSGIVNGVSAGLSLVTYTSSAGCITTAQVTINPLPATTISPATSATVCMGQSTTFTANAPAPAFNILLQNFNSGLGGWTITNTSGNAASYWQITSSATSGATGDGSAMLEASSDAAYSSALQLTTILTSPSFSTLGYGSATVSFNEYLISLTSDANVDLDYSIDNGTTWATILSQVGVGSSLPGGGSGAWSTSGTPEVSVSLPATALGVSNVKLRWHYNAYAGLYWDIDNIMVTAYQPAATYVWSGISGASGLSCTSCATTTITPTATGANVYSVTSSTSAGCQSTTGVTVTVNPMPADVAGTFVICENSVTTLTDATPGGAWSSVSPYVSVDASSGAVTGITAGTAVITYMLPEGCTKTAVVTVNALPAAITGSLQVCEGLTTTLSSTPGGEWTSAVPATATIGSSTGIVNGVAMGTTDVTYTFPVTGCFVSANVTVNHTPAAIGGISVLCETGTTTLTNADGGGAWTSSIPSVASIGSSDGVLSALTAGNTTITYQLPAGCTSTMDFTVNALPAAITGVMQVCEGLTTTLSSTPGGEWTSAVPATATIGSSTGIVNGVAMGTTDVTYTFPVTGCFVSANVTVNHTPAAIGGVSQLCETDITTLTNADAGGAWTSSIPSVASIGSSDGVLSALTAGNTTITYQLPAGCTSTMDFTVNALPAAITGVMQVCEGLTTTLSSTPGGEWTSAVPATATIGSSTGIVNGVAMGTTDVTYTFPATGCFVSANVTVNHTPAAIGGVSQLCETGATTLTNADAGGAWISSITSVASIGSADGVLSALTAGTTTITYQLPAGCTSIMDFTVNALPAPITGVMQVCEGLTTTLNSTTTGGDWTVALPAIASIDISTGIVTGGSTGTSDVTYTLPVTGCFVTANVTVNHTPAAITGAMEVCEGLQTTLGNIDAGGTWFSSATTVATIDVNTGVVSAIQFGNTNITYQLPAGCTSSAMVTVNPLPAAITGYMQVCEGLTTTLADGTAGGAWSSNSVYTSVSGGVVTGVSAGVETITYQLPTTCLRTANVTVNPTPSAITGLMTVCEGLTTTLNDADAGGTWTSGATATATIDPSTGVVAGLVAGVASITYELPTTCINTADVTVNPLPATIVGASQVCEGLTITMTNASPGGNWSSSALGVAVIDGGGVLLGISAGVTTVTYTLPTGCIMTKSVTVNPLPAAINGALQVCAGLTTALTNGTPGGAWSSGTTSVATISTGGVVSAIVAGNTIITYTLPTTCISTANVTVNPLPAAIGGGRVVCEGLTTALSDADAGGTWISSIGSVAGIDGGGVVTGISAGTTSITYTLPTGCITSSDVTVNPLPATIIGVSQVCEGLTTTLTNATGTGTWSSGATTIADINSATGVVTASVAGFAPMTYTLATGCLRTKQVTVNPLPSVIGGSPQVCLSASTTLTNLATGGTWTSNAPGVAPIDPLTGVVNGVTIGSAAITYTLPTGCLMRTGFTVNPLPAPITGPSQLCESAVSAFADGSSGGTWSSSTPLVATINNITGAVTGNASGTTLITYTLGTGCIRTRPITVNPLPAAITGTMQTCQAGTTTLSNGTPGGTWISTDPTIATANMSGVITGVNAGTTLVAYRLSTGCIASAIVTVNTTPSILTSGAVMCQGETISLSTSIAGGSWTSSAPSVAPVDVTGSVSGVGAGLTHISYTMPTGCSNAIAVSVNATPSAIIGAASVCQGSTTTMTSSSAGSVWTSTVTGIASINLTTGVVTGLAAGTTTIRYTNPAGGCFVTHTITVNDMPAAFAGTPVVCNGQTTALSSAPTGGTWTSGTASVATVGTSGAVSGVSAGTAVITYALASGCVRSKIVTVNALPAVFGVTGGGTYCLGGSGVHIGLDNSNGGVAYQLYSGITPVGSAVTGVTGLPLDFGLITASGTYSVVASSTTTGCLSSMSGSTSVSVSSLVPASVSFITGSGSDTVCSGMPVTFTATATNGGTAPVYEWRVNGILITGAAANTYTYTPANGDVLSVNMGSSVACATPAIATAARTITVNTSVMPVAAVAVAPGTTLCQGTSATFSASSLYGGTSPVFTWMKNGMIQTTGPTYTYAPANGDVVYVKLVSNHSCRLADQVSSSSLTMNVNPSYNPAVNITANPGNVIQIGTSVTLTAHVTNAGPSPEYQWYIGSSPIAGATNATFTYNTFGNGDSVSCIVQGTGSCGVAGYNSMIMHVGGVGVPVVVGNADVRLMPNPNKGEFVVRGTLGVASDKEVAIEVTNMLGQVVYRSDFMARNGNVDVQIRLDNTLANGMYMLNMISGGDRKLFHFVLEQ